MLLGSTISLREPNEAPKCIVYRSCDIYTAGNIQYSCMAIHKEERICIAERNNTGTVILNLKEKVITKKTSK